MDAPIDLGADSPRSAVMEYRSPRGLGKRGPSGRRGPYRSAAATRRVKDAEGAGLDVEICRRKPQQFSSSQPSEVEKTQRGANNSRPDSRPCPGGSWVQPYRNR